MFEDELNFAKWKYEKILEQIKEFEDDLDDEHEAAIQFAGFETMYVTGIGYQNPDILYFYGLVGNSDATIIQHMSQLNLLLLAVEKRDKNRPARRIWRELADDE